MEVRDPTGTVDERSDRHPLSGSDRARQVARRVLIAGIGDGEFGEKGARVGGGIQRVDARKATRPPSRRDATWNSGNSARHGAHHDAQTLTTTGKPRRCARRARKPAVPPPNSSLRWACNATNVGGEPARAARGVAGVAARLGGWIAPQPAATSANVINPSGTTGRFVNTIQRSNQGVS